LFLKVKFFGQFTEKFIKNLETIDFSIVYKVLLTGANEVVIYNFLALLTIDTNINQFIKVYHIFYKIQYQYKKIYKIYKNNKKPRFKSEEEQVCSFLQQS